MTASTRSWVIEAAAPARAPQATTPTPVAPITAPQSAKTTVAAMNPAMSALWTAAHFIFSPSQLQCCWWSPDELEAPLSSELPLPPPPEVPPLPGP
jgi:hypothetical protein